MQTSKAQSLERVHTFEGSDHSILLILGGLHELFLWEGFAQGGDLFFVRKSLGMALGPVGVGVDIVAVKRISRLLERHGARFLNRAFHEDEQVAANAMSEGRSAFLAGR